MRSRRLQGAEVRGELSWSGEVPEINKFAELEEVEELEEFDTWKVKISKRTRRVR